MKYESECNEINLLSLTTLRKYFLVDHFDNNSKIQILKSQISNTLHNTLKYQIPPAQ